jgi:VanZ family protein
VSWTRALAPIAWMGAIFLGSAKEAVDAPLPAWIPVMGHLIEYAVLATLWAWALAPRLGRRALVVAAAISLLYGISDEYHQRFVEGRDSNVLDVLTDAVGIAFATWLSARRAGWHRRQTSR